MLLSFGLIRFRVRQILLTLFFGVAIWLFLLKEIPSLTTEQRLEQRFPLAWKYIHLFNGTGGAWYIPPEWIDGHAIQPQTITEAARLASKVAASDTQRQIPFSNIPLIIHQTWKTSSIDAWSTETLSWVEKWLDDAIMSESGRHMAYFFWDDEGMLALIREFESGFLEPFTSLFTPVERADIFRILVCKWFGGIYGDVDTEPLRHPSAWISRSDLATWEDNETGDTYGLSTSLNTSGDPQENERPVNLLWGLEADTDPSSDSFWRMGYSYPVQLTQWALASAPKHPVLSEFMMQLNAQIKNETRLAREDASIKPDPLTRTGPAAVTLATKTWLQRYVGFRWNSLTGLKDGGKAKLVSDVLVLPITGFSPGRGKYGNMGSKASTDPDARLYHHAQGSWRHFDLKVEYGKLCRTIFGLCKNWSKV